MSTKATQETAFSVFRSAQQLLEAAHGVCDRNITKIDGGGYNLQHVEHLIDQLRGMYSSIPDPTSWGTGLKSAINTIALEWLNVTDYDLELASSRSDISTVMQTASDLFPRDGSNNVLYKQITPGSTTYSSPSSTVGLRADLVTARDQIG